jgi:hypothetical protein
MDINYLLGREQVSLPNAAVAASSTARIAHQGLAAAYGKLLAEGGFPHRVPQPSAFKFVPVEDGGQWDDDGGPSR